MITRSSSLKVPGSWLVALALCACGGSSDTGNMNNAANGGGSGAGASTGDASVADVNLACPEYVGPFEGQSAQHDECCRRASNTERLAKDESSSTATLEYRMNFVQTINQPLTLGLDTIKNLNIIRVEDEQQSELLRFEVPRENGKLASGAGKLTIGVGRYNCDGTYSYYTDTAAPVRPESSNDPKRWAPKHMDLKVDATKNDASRYQPVWSTNYNRGFTLMPYLNTATFAMDWELWDQGFSFEKMPTGDAALDCVGKRTKEGLWEGGGTFIAYATLERNDHDPISALAEQTMCQLLAFGVVVDKDDPNNSCSKTSRCEPGKSGCTWQKLPDSLCPATADEQTTWGCHVGYENNPDGEKTNCTVKAPSAPLDPDQGATSEGQCCDPLAKGTGGLPACNAYMLRNSFVAAAAEITDDKVSELQTNCRGMQ